MVIKIKFQKKKYPVFFHKNRKLHCMFNKKPIIWAFKDPNNKFNKEKLKAIKFLKNCPTEENINLNLN